MINTDIFPFDWYNHYLKLPKQEDREVKEEIDYLKNLRKKEHNHRIKTRIQSLILTKEKSLNNA